MSRLDLRPNEMRSLWLLACFSACTHTTPSVPSCVADEQPQSLDHTTHTLEAQCFTPEESKQTDGRELEATRACTDDVCRFRIAQKYYDERHYVQASQLLLRIADRATSPLAARAAELAVESIIALGATGRQACFDLLATSISKFLDQFCTPIPASGADELCANSYVADVDMARCSECNLGSVSGREPTFEQFTAARLFFEIASRRCIFGRGDELTSQVVNEMRRCDQMLERAAQLYERAGVDVRAREVRDLLLDPQNGLDQTEGALRVKTMLRARADLIRTPQSP